MGSFHSFNNCTQQLIYFLENQYFTRASAMKPKKELRSTHGNLNQLKEVTPLTGTAVEELEKHVLLDGVHAPLNDLVIFKVFEQFQVEGDDLALNDRFVTLLGRKEHKESFYEFMHQKISNRKISQMEIFSLPLSSSSKYLRKEGHHLLHLDYLHS